ncbi:hypothetical protein STXM2123_3794 [Streptomyces sp. F-3]|nr:hypothetical protein STXM2123_3794 [Streptomyces sp. F-3]
MRHRTALPCEGVLGGVVLVTRRLRRSSRGLTLVVFVLSAPRSSLDRLTWWSPGDRSLVSKLTQESH